MFKIERLAMVATLVLFALGSPARAWAESRVDSIGITVTDLDRALTFYTSVLPFTEIGAREVAGPAYEHAYGVFGLRMQIVRLALGDEQIELMAPLAPRGRPMPVDSRSNDLWFQHIAIIVSDMEAAYRHLRAHRVEHASSGPQVLPDWNPNAGGIAAFYFRDPDGNHLEILEFPPGKGEPRWQSDERLFLGIDHTAIVVADTEASLGFYRDTLGLRVAGSSENHGPEQERLNNVFGARLVITALRAEHGIGVELLEYLAPRTGRPMPLDTQTTDAWHWQINVTRGELDTLAAAIRLAGYRHISPGIVSLPHTMGRVLLARDPDGHALMFSGTEARP